MPPRLRNDYTKREWTRSNRVTVLILKELLQCVKVTSCIAAESVSTESAWDAGRQAGRRTATQVKQKHSDKSQCKQTVLHTNYNKVDVTRNPKMEKPHQKPSKHEMKIAPASPPNLHFNFWQTYFAKTLFRVQLQSR